MLRATIERAQSDVLMVVGYLEMIGAIPPPAQRKRDSALLPLDLMLKLAAWLRLRNWEMAGLRPFLKRDLPTSDEVLSDLRARPPHELHPARQIIAQTLATFLREMAWEQGASTSDVVVNAIDGDEVIDRLAAFLWQFRHVAT
jgi:hypothetical protein